MNIKKLVLLGLIIYVVVAGAVLVYGFFVSEPDPEISPAQALLILNTDAQNGIAVRTNQIVDQIASSGNGSDTPDKVTPPKSKDSNDNSTASTTGSTNKKTTTTTKPEPKKACGAGGGCTVAQVSTHNTQGNCWVMYGGKVYNVTAYANAHPGGAGAFDASTCGTDITAQLQGSASSSSLGGRTKNHPSSAYSQLSNYYIDDVVSG
jgi:hypothetical protein